MKKEKHSIRTSLIWAGIILGVALLVFCLIKFVIIPTHKYNEALSLQRSGNTEAAYDIFSSLGNFGDSIYICNEYNYQTAVDLLEQGKYHEAYLSLCKTNQYSEADVMKEKLLGEYPYLSAIAAQVGDVVTLGEYEQDNDKSNGPEPIEWYVLAQENGNTLLFSKYVLDAQQFNTENAEECMLDDWLQDTFGEKAFSNINGYKNVFCVTLLTRKLWDQYCTEETKYCDATVYAEDLEGYRNGFLGYYWLADVERHGIWIYAKEGDGCTGTITDDKVTSISGVRPILWICPNGKEDFPEKYQYSGKVIPTDSYKICSVCEGTGKVVNPPGNFGNFQYGYAKGDRCAVCDEKGYIK